MKIGYFIKDCGQTMEDTIYFDEQAIVNPKEEIILWGNVWAEKASDYAWDHNDGWEWLRTGTVLTIVFGKEEMGDYEIELDNKPCFNAIERRIFE